MIVGGYSLDLYCAHMEELPTFYEADIRPTPPGWHAYGEFPHQFQGQTIAGCKRAARERGWRFRAGDATCPRCVRYPASVRNNLALTLSPKEESNRG